MGVVREDTVSDQPSAVKTPTMQEFRLHPLDSHINLSPLPFQVLPTVKREEALVDKGSNTVWII